MKKELIILTTVMLVLISLVGFKQKDTIIIYSSLEQFRGEELQKQLDEEFPEIKTKLMYVPTGKVAAKVVLEGARTEADIIVGLETSYMIKIQEHLADIEGLSRIPYEDHFMPELNDNKYVIWERQAGSFIVNKDVLKKYNIKTPKNYSDLLKPELKNLIAMSDPKSSGTGYFFMKNRMNVLGEQNGFSYFDNLSENVKQFTESGSGPIKLLNQGEVAVGLGLTFQAMNEINKGKPFEIIFPPEGSPYSLTGTAMIKGRENNQNVQKIFDFIINDFIIYDKEYFSPEMIFDGQVNRIKNYPENINYADMEGIQSIEDKERLLKLWKY
ncbi:extracellular solute-binding protein [Erysipelothrix urinaevulpis]|uniref:extracellular solute-binding protein n=1 Tax=Erysipelothrix urinaevulpis TaxID=2683717 RepID=UPI001356E882|nr:extracellular solute-binding protein [Erysipelothrix urinaevulpis]